MDEDYEHLLRLAMRWARELEGAAEILQNIHPSRAAWTIGILQVSAALQDIADELHAHRAARWREGARVRPEPGEFTGTVLTGDDVELE